MPVGALPFILLLVIVFDRNTEIKIEDIITIYVELNNNNNNNIFDRLCGILARVPVYRPKYTRFGYRLYQIFWYDMKVTCSNRLPVA